MGIKIIVGVMLVAFIAQTLGHSYLTNPTTRSNQKQSVTGCRGPNCLGPCDRSLAGATRAPIAVSRGDSILLEWPRNNHAAGFIRLSWAPTSQSDSHQAFDDGVQQIVCHEIGGCKPDDITQPNSGDSAPNDGSRQPCTTSINVPNHLADGTYTLQWAWFGGAFALGDYYSCVDYIVSGGSSAARVAPVFKGGDFTYPGQQKCKYFNTDRLHQCVNEPCDNPYYTLYQERSGMPYMPAFTSGAAATTAAAAPATTAAAAPATTGRPAPATTAAATTGRPAPATTAAATTAKPAPVTTGQVASQPPTNGGTSSNCASLTTRSTSTAEMTDINTWGTTWQAVITITVAEAQLPTWYLQIVYPAGLANTKITNVYNAGKLSCEGNGHSVIKPTASWAMNKNQGDTITIEVVGTNDARLSSAQIKANTQLKVFKN